ncbi:MAG TPA: c-type cytochrome [Gemmatimonadales bacterium]|nr:c-type cytochrome [Gemmatimonadales bacterium]
MAVRVVAAAPLLALLVSSAQQPVPPSVRYGEHVFAGGSPPPAGSLQNPFEGDRQSAAAGEKLFAAFNCDGCHGGGAVGAQGPNLADGRWRYGGGDGAIFHSVYYGRPRGMPAFGGILPPDAIWKLVTYLRTLQPATDEATVSWIR